MPRAGRGPRRFSALDEARGSAVDLMKYLCVMDIPTPWREPVFERVHRLLGGEFHVAYFRNTETRRLWKFPMGAQPKTMLPGINFMLGGSERFFNPGIVGFLLRHRPRVALVFASIKDPSGLLAMLVCRLMGTKIVLLDDSWMGRDRHINWVQRLARRIVYRFFGDVFVGASRQTQLMFQHYNPRIRPEQLFLSHLVADNEFFRARLAAAKVEREFDVLLSGRIAPEKNPIFFGKVCARIKALRGSCRALILGSGDESIKAAMEAELKAGGVDFHYAGFVQRDDLPEAYARAKLLLLPSNGDCWGVVINEAMAAGAAVITTEWTAAAGELVMNDRNGYVLPLNVEVWAGHITNLLDNPEKLQSFADCAGKSVDRFSFDSAAEGLAAALRFAAGEFSAQPGSQFKELGGPAV